MTSRRLVIVATLAFTLQSCRSEHLPPPQSTEVEGGLRAIPAFELVIRETEVLYLANPRFLALTDSGDFYVSDGFYERVVRYNRSGDPVAVIGQKGSGPGEFRSVGMILPLDDGRIAIADNSLRRLSFFEQESGTPLSSVNYNGIIYHGQSDAAGLWLGDLNMERRTGVARYEGNDSIFQYLVPVPHQYELGGPLAGIYNGVALLVWKDTMLVAFAGSNTLYMADTLGRLIDSVAVPRQHRRGVPDNTEELFSPEHQRSQPDFFSAISEFYWIHRLSGDRILVAHRDGHIDGRLITATLYVSILAPDLRTACVDARIPSTGDSPVVADFKGDTIFVLNQRADSSDNLVSTLLGYVLDDTDCEWQRAHP